MSMQNVASAWPPPGCPELAWPQLPDQGARISWYRAVVEAYARQWPHDDEGTRLAPASEEAMAALERRLGPLPPSLRRYHREVGALRLAERLCSVEPSGSTIEPLTEILPATDELEEDSEELRLVRRLVVFGDDHGNLMCFHRDSGAVYYLDHDGGLVLSLLFDSPEHYLDALMIRSLGELWEDEDGAEELLRHQLGERVVNHWLG